MRLRFGGHCEIKKFIQESEKLKIIVRAHLYY